MKYLNPMWHAYNQGLARITDKERSEGPLIAKGCGHFVQKDDPQYVVSLLSDMLDKIILVSNSRNTQTIPIFPSDLMIILRSPNHLKMETPRLQIWSVSPVERFGSSCRLT